MEITMNVPVAQRRINMSKITTPSVLSFTRRIAPGEACMFRTNWNDRNTLDKLEIKEKTLRTALSNRLKKKEAQEEGGKKLKESNPADWQLHGVEYCTLGSDYDTLAVRFIVKFLGGLSPYACNDIKYVERVNEMIRDYMDNSGKTTGIGDLGLRYARNLVGAKFLWRNRFEAEEIETEIVDISRGNNGEKLVFNSLEIPFDFDQKVDPESDFAKLGNKIADVLGDPSPDRLLTLEVTAYARMGRGAEVYPSQEMTGAASKNALDKLLHSIDGVAAMTSQKIGNAIRRIDTWYKGYEEFGEAISVEAYGTNTAFGQVFRNDKKNGCFYNLYDSWVAGESISPTEKDYVIAMLIRGGIFGEKNN